MPGEALASEEIEAGLGRAIERAKTALVRRQNPDGHFAFPLEADATIPAEYVLLEHFLDRIDRKREQKIGVYLRGIQGADGGWPLFYGGAANLSASVKAYFALKAIGDRAEEPHMRRAREAILQMGGAERTNVFTRIQLALFGAVPWRAVPMMPVELMLLPRWFFFHISKVSYWSRTTIAPLVVLMALQPRARNPRGAAIDELFITPPDRVQDWIQAPDGSLWGRFFVGLDRLLRVIEPVLPKGLRRRAIARALAYIAARLNGEDGLGAIYPPMANAVMMYDALGVRDDKAEIAWRAMQKLQVMERDRAWVSPCLSPVWDTALAGLALVEAGDCAGATAAARWLAPLQERAIAGDWAMTRPGVRPGGWAFQYANAFFPDVDDTAVVGMLLDRVGGVASEEAIPRAAEWIEGMQGKSGGWGAFDADNTHDVLAHIPFADHGALLDPPTSDVTARCVSFLCQIGHSSDHPVIRRALRFLEREQEQDGSWFGRWGTNYIYGTWSVLCALNAARVPSDAPMVRRAVAWLVQVQREDGGWGEDCATYGDAPHGRYRESTPSHTAWAVLGLIAAGEVEHPVVARGISWLVANQRESGEWTEAAYNAVGFPRVFYLHYHGYRSYFPLLALTRYDRLRRHGERKVAFGF